MSRTALAQKAQTPHSIAECEAAFVVADRSSPLASPEALTLAVRREVLPALETAFSMAQADGIAGQFEMIEVDLGDLGDPPEWHVVRERFAQRLYLALRAQAYQGMALEPDHALSDAPVRATQVLTAPTLALPRHDHAAAVADADAMTLPVLRALLALSRGDRLAELRRLRAALQRTAAQAPFLADKDWRPFAQREETMLAAAFLAAGLVPSRVPEAIRLLRRALDAALGRPAEMASDIFDGTGGRADPGARLASPFRSLDGDGSAGPDRADTSVSGRAEATAHVSDGNMSQDVSGHGDAGIDAYAEPKGGSRLADPNNQGASPALAPVGEAQGIGADPQAVDGHAGKGDRVPRAGQRPSDAVIQDSVAPSLLPPTGRDGRDVATVPGVSPPALSVGTGHAETSFQDRNIPSPRTAPADNAEGRGVAQGDAAPQADRAETLEALGPDTASRQVGMDGHGPVDGNDGTATLPAMADAGQKVDRATAPEAAAAGAAAIPGSTMPDADGQVSDDGHARGNAVHATGQDRADMDAPFASLSEAGGAQPSQARPDKAHSAPLHQTRPLGLDQDQLSAAAQPPAEDAARPGMSADRHDTEHEIMGAVHAGDATAALAAQLSALLDALGPVPTDIAQAIARLAHEPLAMLNAHVLRAVINTYLLDEPGLVEALARFALHGDTSPLAVHHAHAPAKLAAAFGLLPKVVLGLLSARLARFSASPATQDELATQDPRDARDFAALPRLEHDGRLPLAHSLAATMAAILEETMPMPQPARDQAPAEQDSGIERTNMAAASATTSMTAMRPGHETSGTTEAPVDLHETPATPERALRDALRAQDAAALDVLFLRDPYGLLSALERQPPQELATLIMLLRPEMGSPPAIDAGQGAGQSRETEDAPPTSPEALLVEVIARLSERQGLLPEASGPAPETLMATKSPSQPGVAGDAITAVPGAGAGEGPGRGRLLVDALRLIWSVLPEGLARGADVALSGRVPQPDDRARVMLRHDPVTSRGAGPHPSGTGGDMALRDPLEGQYAALITQARLADSDRSADTAVLLAQAIAALLQGVTNAEERAALIAALHARWRSAAAIDGLAPPLARNLLAALYSIIPDLAPAKPDKTVFGPSSVETLPPDERRHAFVEAVHITALANPPGDLVQATKMIAAMDRAAVDLSLADTDRALAMTTLAVRLARAGDPIPALSQAMAAGQMPPSAPDTSRAYEGGLAQAYARAIETLATPGEETRALPMVAQLQTAVTDILSTLSTPEQRSLAVRTAYVRLRHATLSAQGPRQIALSALRGLDPTLAEPSRDEAHAQLSRVAGIVLIGPYLKPLFSRAALLDPENRIPPEQLPRAAGLLRAVSGFVDGGLDPLERVLLGVPRGVDIPLLPVSLAHADLVESLLEAVIGQWSALGKTSVAGLREAFMRREGDLFFEGTGGARLHVHKGPFDVLLDRLPWSLSPLRAPWMPAPLIVRWRSQDD